MPLVNREHQIRALTPTGELIVDAANVAQAPVAGWLSAVVLYDRTTGEDWIWSEESERYQLPVDIPYGHLIAVSGMARNTGTEPQHMKLTIMLVDPNGVVAASKVNDTRSINPDVSFTALTDAVVADILGMWVIYGVLEAELA